jgi:hypothetical protein
VGKIEDNMAKTKKQAKPDLLENRKDLFDNWVLQKWFDKKQKKIMSENNIFEKLFMALYDDLTTKFDAKKRDDIFTNFINVVFPTVLDVYKWHESERQHNDIGLVHALESISYTDWFIDLLHSYSRQYEGS